MAGHSIQGRDPGEAALSTLTSLGQMGTFGEAGRMATSMLGVIRRPDGAEGWLRGQVDSRLRNISFAFALNDAAAQESLPDGSPGGRAWTFWGESDTQSYASGGDGERFNGALRSTWLGVDAAFGDRWLAGVGLSRGRANTDFDTEAVSGELQSEMLTLTPYARRSFGERFELWGFAGIGRGDIHGSRRSSAAGAASSPSATGVESGLASPPEALSDPGTILERGDLSLGMVSLGARRALPALGPVSLSLLGDVGVSRLGVEDAVIRLSARFQASAVESKIRRPLACYVLRMNLPPEKWHPLTGMPEGALNWSIPGYDDLAERWANCTQALKTKPEARNFLDVWLRERVRAFAIETGQIEGLYTLRRGVTEQLIAEGFAGAVGSHTFEGVEDDTLRGLLNDQEAAYDMMFEDVASGRPLSAYMVKSWHQMLTRHQETVTCVQDHMGRVRRVEVPFETKGRWKIRPNNPRRLGGKVHEYCPPELVPDEMERFFSLAEDIRQRRYPVNVEGAWLHHRFVRTHPFQDGNGRTSRLLMAWAFVKRGLPPPVIAAQEKPAYIDALEAADEGNLRAFSNRIGYLALATLSASVDLAERVLTGRLERSHGNGGRQVGGTYYPPLE